MKFKKILHSTLNEMALIDVIVSIIISADRNGIRREDFFEYYLQTLRSRISKETPKETSAAIKRQISADILKLQEHLDPNKPSIPMLVKAQEKGIDDEAIKVALEELKKGKRKTQEKKKGVRSSNEEAINEIINSLMKNLKIPVVKFDTKGTRINRNFIANLKRDQKITLEGEVVFEFETKNAPLSRLKSSGGVLFADIGKAFTDKTKKEIEEQIKTNPVFQRKFENHNRKIKSLFADEVLKQINEEMNNVDKPYLIIGEEKNPEKIFVVSSEQYVLFAERKSFANVLRVEIKARLKEGVSLTEIRTLKSFFEEMVVESNTKKLNQILLKDNLC